MPLTMLRAGGLGKVKEIRGGRGLVQRLSAIGIFQGTEIRIVKGGGPVIIDLKGNRLVLGRGMAHSVMVEPLP